MASNETDVPIVIREARQADIEQVRACIEPFIKLGRLLPRTADEMEGLLANCFVAERGDRIVGCAALDVYSRKMAEIRSLAVSPDVQRMGIGKQLVEACVDRARQLHILEVMAITSTEEFFRSCGFDFTLPGEKKALFLQTRELP